MKHDDRDSEVRPDWKLGRLDKCPLSSSRAVSDGLDL